MEPPNKIYLQWYIVDPEYGEEFGRTWCQDKINDNDVEYVLAARVEELEEVLRQAATWIENFALESPYEHDRSENIHTLIMQALGGDDG